LESSFVNLEELGRLHYPWLPVLWLLRIQYPNLERIARISAPTMLAHSPSDAIVPFEHSRRLYEMAAANDKWLMPVDGGHNADYWRSTTAYRRCWSDFVRAIRGEPVDGVQCN
jgi:fermentation-respiration switch protein FrsA (DUF1100 family)